MVRFILMKTLSFIGLTNESQFHYGSIHTMKTKFFFSLKVRVSIPLWFDSYLKGADIIIVSKEESQFHYGSIHTQVYQQHLKNYPKSQFHYGSIHTMKYLIITTILSAVSIPLWFDSYSCITHKHGC
jgi:hypothetical protein